MMVSESVGVSLPLSPFRKPISNKRSNKPAHKTHVLAHGVALLHKIKRLKTPLGAVYKVNFHKQAYTAEGYFRTYPFRLRFKFERPSLVFLKHRSPVSGTLVRPLPRQHPPGLDCYNSLPLSLLEQPCHDASLSDTSISTSSASLSCGRHWVAVNPDPFAPFRLESFLASECLV